MDRLRARRSLGGSRTLRLSARSSLRRSSLLRLALGCLDCSNAICLQPRSLTPGCSGSALNFCACSSCSGGDAVSLSLCSRLGSSRMRCLGARCFSSGSSISFQPRRFPARCLHLCSAALLLRSLREAAGGSFHLLPLGRLDRRDCLRLPAGLHRAVCCSRTTSCCSCRFRLRLPQRWIRGRCCHRVGQSGSGSAVHACTAPCRHDIAVAARTIIIMIAVALLAQKASRSVATTPRRTRYCCSRGRAIRLRDAAAPLQCAAGGGRRFGSCSYGGMGALIIRSLGTQSCDSVGQRDRRVKQLLAVRLARRKMLSPVRCAGPCSLL